MRLRIEFSETWRNFEQLRGLRLVPNVLGGNGGAVLRFDPQRIEVRIYIRQALLLALFAIL